MRIEVFKTGNHTDAGGTVFNCDDKRLHQIAEDYNKSDHDAPVVIGHPADNAPAYGWVETLSVEDDRLMAELRDIQPEFKDWVNRSLFKKRSISLYPDGLLRHVGFLGAQPPAVKGLEDFEFKSGGGFEQYEYGDTKQNKEVDMTVEELQKQVEALTEQVKELAEGKTKETERADKAEGELEKVNAEFADAKHKQTEADLTQFVDQLVAEHKILPKSKDNIMAFAEGLSKGGTVINFSDDEMSPLDAFKALMSDMPEISDMTADFSDDAANNQPEKSEPIKTGQV